MSVMFLFDAKKNFVFRGIYAASFGRERSAIQSLGANFQAR